MVIKAWFYVIFIKIVYEYWIITTYKDFNYYLTQAVYSMVGMHKRVKLRYTTNVKNIFIEDCFLI